MYVTLAPPVYVVEWSHADMDEQLPPAVEVDPKAEVVVVEKGRGVATELVEEIEEVATELWEAGGVVALKETEETLLETGGGASPETGHESALAAVMNSEPASGYSQSIAPPVQPLFFATLRHKARSAAVTKSLASAAVAGLPMTSFSKGTPAAESSKRAEPGNWVEESSKPAQVTY